MPTCCGEVVKNHALGQEFYVCRKCKKEVEAMPPTNPVGSTYTFNAAVYPGTPAPIAVELVEQQLELFDPWTTGLSSDNEKDDDNGQEDQKSLPCPLADDQISFWD